VPVELSIEQSAFLRWSFGEYFASPCLPHERVLEGFLDLEEATGDEILRFARLHGVLGLCEHDIPDPRGLNVLGPSACRPWNRWILDCPICSAGLYENMDTYRPLFLRFAYVGIMQARDFGPALGEPAGSVLSFPVPREPLQAWRDLARRLNQALRLARALRTHETPRWADLQFNASFEGFTGDATGIPESTMWAMLLSFAKNLAQNDGLVTLEVGLDETVQAVKLELLGTGLAGQLATEFLSWVSSPVGFFQCDNRDCARFYDGNERKRNPGTSQKYGYYCPDCSARDYAAVRSAKYRRKNPEVKRRRVR